jgi:hypothetical protein
MTTTAQVLYSNVTVRGTEYMIIRISEDMGHLGSKFFGKRVFTLRDAAGNTFTYFGKRVTRNARLTSDDQVKDN